jgi:hypothetical protein
MLNASQKLISPYSPPVFEPSANGAAAAEYSSNRQANKE